jgi:hypothetical protein
MVTRPVLYLGGTPPSTPTVADVPPFQATLPTSAYGQTIPVIWGIARLPSAYIWCAPILTVTSTHQEWWDKVTTTTTGLTARLRFARPLVPDSQWSLRKFYANGKLIYDGTTGYRASGLKFRFYDGRSSQGRDPAMVREEGAANVSAHRGYIDIVVENYNVFGFGSPPVFEAEVVQAIGAGFHQQLPGFRLRSRQHGGGGRLGQFHMVWLFSVFWAHQALLNLVPARNLRRASQRPRQGLFRA